MSKHEGYIHDLCDNLDYSISIHRCSEFADGVIFMELFYKDQKHVMVMNADQAKKIGLYLYDAAKKLKAERIEQLKMATLFSFIFSSVANGEPPIGTPLETFQKFAKITRYIMKERYELIVKSWD